MKKILLLIIVLLSHLCCMAQQQVESAIGTITIPKEANKISKDEAVAFTHNKFKHQQTPGKFDKIYNVGDIIITIREQANLPDVNYTIENQKAQTESLFKRAPIINVHQSKIISVNTNRFYIFEYQQDDEITLSFMCDIKNKNTVTCILKYKSVDEDKAQKIFKKIMNDFKYKN